MDIFRSSFYQTKWKSLHQSDLVFFPHAILFVVIPKYRSPRDTFLCNRPREFSQHRLGVPRCPLSVELIAGENNQVRLFLVNDVGYQTIGEVVGVFAWVENCISTDSLRNGKMEVSNLEDLELAGM